ncbi:glycine/D-amino acid oxidase [Ameyamaea chiangmaiensis NBRC 103196]|uniref:FAD-binding oxidoreductase n=1 Tax=Ameyamaea chiangmaiensis TaxID=442969 RepID=A0A850P450_9PROT|nr:FAD-binding oxidoreductase [Ameyamaea chiangmaiensis]MBS4074017.1 FAD-binding oxidoreductase [Ameyamaea chiangmaiensis]NVN39427.1 FAD-binding oxidoreductase [Ameyamaea chiangmaiensis]GBQ67591.1 glycine/D-amino acid oxidase [Ameyamaea chiangmaiensis NBRC 103196]
MTEPLGGPFPSGVYDLTAPAPIATRPLHGAARTRTAIIGAGITGLSAALHLAESGHDVCVLDAGSIGWGASGRNGGHVNPGLKLPPSDVERRFGPEAGARLVKAAWAAPDLVFDLVGRHGLSCEARQGGTIRAATGTSQLMPMQALMAECLTLGRDVAWLDTAAMHASTGAHYAGGMIDRSGGQLNPLAYSRELARVATGKGAVIHTHARASSLRREAGRWLIGTAAGTLAAEHVVFATNGYTDRLWDRLRRSVVPVFSAIVATRPLPDAVRRAVMADGQVLYEVGHITTYYRVDAQGRLVFGGRSGMSPANGVAAFPTLVRRACELWPMLSPDDFTHGWNGQIAATSDHYPHWHEPMPGIFAAVGYNGRGVAMATLLGRELARRVGGTAERDLLLPPTPLKPIRGHAAWKLAVAAKIAEGRLRDQFDL